MGQTKAMRLLGAMSGTSTDGVDVAGLLADPDLSGLEYAGLTSIDFSDAFRARLLRLQNPRTVYAPGEDPLALMAEARYELSLLYAQAANTLLRELGWAPSTVVGYGVHGQTMRHAPEKGYSFQIIDASLIGAKVGVPVVADFRSADVAVGGEGAPLVPAFHQAWLASQRGAAPAHPLENGCVAVLNLGGFSNLTLLNAQSQVVAGGDCGPANCYLDWCARTHFDQPHDAQGAMARSGRVDEALLRRLVSHPFFLRSWPASTGREAFSLAWLEAQLVGFEGLAPRDLMATLLEMAVFAVSRCLSAQPGGRVLVCGGGVRNAFLIERLSLKLGTPWAVYEFDKFGLPAQAVEAAAFAWLAGCHRLGLAGNCPVATGASASAVLGLSTLTPASV